MSQPPSAAEILQRFLEATTRQYEIGLDLATMNALFVALLVESGADIGLVEDRARRLLEPGLSPMEQTRFDEAVETIMVTARALREDGTPPAFSLALLLRSAGPRAAAQSAASAESKPKGKARASKARRRRAPPAEGSGGAS